MPDILEMRGICKRYDGVRANHGIDFAVPRGRIVGLLGENGSGKSTLMKVLFGMVVPDSGSIRFNGQPLHRHRPGTAIAAGMGMIHQHFMLVDAMTVVENVMLGWRHAGRWLRRDTIAAQIRSASESYGLGLDPDAIVATLPFGLRQRVEIMKLILRGADLLILDEPTSNLSPPEVAGLLGIMRRLREEGRSVIFISHKLREVLDVCDEVVVLRDGEVAGSRDIGAATRDDLARLMIGRDLRPPAERAARDPGPEQLALHGVSLRDSAGIERLRDVSLSLRAGEILAVAGVDGNGQSSLVEVIAGLARADSGTVTLLGRDISDWDVGARLAAGLAYIPVDRAGESLVPDMTIEDNLALRDFDRPPLRRGATLDRASFRALADQRIREFAIRCTGARAPARTLSGGNQQKIVVAREVGRRPRILVALQPTWGLDPGAARFVIDQVLALRDAGGAVLYISAELDEVLMLGDRIAVMHGGRLSDAGRRDEADPMRIGLLMAGAAEAATLH